MPRLLATSLARRRSDSIDRRPVDETQAGGRLSHWTRPYGLSRPGARSGTCTPMPRQIETEEALLHPTACPMTDLAIKQCRVWRFSESVMPSNAVVPSQLCLLTPYALLSRTATDGPASSGLSQHAMNSRFSLLNIQHVSCIHECGVKLAGKTCFLPTETNGLTGNSMGIQVPGSRRTASQSGHPVLAICRPCH